MKQELALDVCLAVRRERLDEARTGFKKIMALTDQSVWLRLTEDVLLAALRRRQLPLFAEWLAEAQPGLMLLLERRELAEETGRLLQALAFALCDRRAQQLELLRPLVRQWLRTYGGEETGDAFRGEWLNLAARMARRGWQPQAHLLLSMAVYWAVRQRDIKSWRQLLTRISLHFTVYARRDGFPAACSAYPELTLLYLLLLRRAGRCAQQGEAGAAWLLLALRSIRDLIANVSRGAMQDDMEIFRQWYQFLWQQAGQNEARRDRVRLLLQLAIRYWQGTRPKTSRRQAAFLQDLLTPSCITEEYERLLEKII